MIENQFERFETGSLRIRSSLRAGIKVLPTVAMLGFVLFAAGGVSEMDSAIEILANAIATQKVVILFEQGRSKKRFMA